MKIPYGLYVAVMAILAFLGFSITKEREIKKLLKQTKSAEMEAADAKREFSRKEHQRKRQYLESELARERARQLSSRIRDSYGEYERRRGAS